MTDAAWELEAEPGWTWLLLPFTFDPVTLGDRDILRQMFVETPRLLQVRAITIFGTLEVFPHCVTGTEGEFATTEAHEASIHERGRLIADERDLRELDSLTTWARGQLIAAGLAEERIRHRMDPAIVEGSRPPSSLIRARIYLRILVARDDVVPPAYWGPPEGLGAALGP